MVILNLFNLNTLLRKLSHNHSKKKKKCKVFGLLLHYSDNGMNW